MKIKIVGAGIAGLAAAWYLQKIGHVTIYEKSHRVGGWIETIHQDGFCFEQGPRGFRPSGNGKETVRLCKALGLELLPANAAAKTRFICRGGELEAFSPRRMIGGLIKDLFARRPTRDDETLEEFFGRHIGRKLTADYLDPLARGIFGGDYRRLSARSCFPSLWKERSLVLMKREKVETSLYSFREGMEALPRALAEKLDVEILLDTPVEQVEGDVVIWATPQARECATLSTVSLGWNHERLKQSGYGFLVPSTEPEPFYGMTWDSMIFPEQEGKTRVCVMIPESGSDEELLEVATHAVGKYTGISAAPDAMSIGRAMNAIPQYYLGHHRWVEEIERQLPKGHYVIGSSFRGVGINDCVAGAHRVASLLEGVSLQSRG